MFYIYLILRITIRFSGIYMPHPNAVKGSSPLQQHDLLHAKIMQIGRRIKRFYQYIFLFAWQGKRLPRGTFNLPRGVPEKSARTYDDKPALFDV